MKKFVVLTFILINIKASSQNTVNVSNLNVKLSFGETKNYFFAFEKGDTIVFNLKMIKGKHIRILEIHDSENGIKYTKFKANNISNKKIKVLKKGVYRFKFYSEAIFNRVANVNIQRIPADDSLKDFNTNWKWETVRDTTYTHYTKDSLIGYKTILSKETIKELKNEEVKEITLIDKTQRVHSFYNGNSSKTYLKVDLPTLNNSRFKEENLIAWSYWIGVGQQSKKAYDENIRGMIKLLKKGAGVYFQTPLAGIAIGAITNLITPQNGDDVEYCFVVDFENIKNFLNNQQFYLFDKGKGIAAYGRNDKNKTGSFYIGLSNDNLIRGIDVNVKIVAVKEIRNYENVTYDREKKRTTISYAQ